MAGLLIADINKIKKPIIKIGLLALVSAYLLTGCTQQVTDNMAFKNGQPNSEKMFMDLSENKELSASLSKNWDKVDRIFLEEIPNSIYIDKRTTHWKSDVFSPMIGGASPSHYQSGYYKELFNDIISFLSRDSVDEKRYNQ